MANRGGFRAPKAPEVLAEKIRQQIVLGELKEGDVLPTEAVLTERFGVSRPTIREAYRILEYERLLSITRGAKGGAVVHAPDSALIANYFLMMLQTERATIGEIYEARSAFEPALARMVARSNGKASAAILRECLAEEHASLDIPEKFSKAVTEFHRTMVKLSGNRPLLHLFDAIYNVIQRHQTRVVAHSYRAGTKTEALSNPLRGLKSQEKLIDLIEAGDADGAEAHWRKHMEQASKVWINGFEQTTILELTRD